MFHRVKSEDQEPEEVSVLTTDQQDAQRQTRDDITEFKGPDSDEKAEPQSSTSTVEKTPQEEDQGTMTDQDKTSTEQEDSAPAVMGAYQRPGQAPVRAAGGYPGAYPGLGSASADAGDRRLTIGSGITMSGEIESCDYLLVEGTVEAALKGANVLEIAESGTFYGTVEINEANIAGRFEGDITVSGRLTVSSTGTVTGSISYKEIALEAGAIIDGKLTPLSAVPAAAKKPSATPKVAKPAAPKVEKIERQPEPANNDEGLFSKAAAAAE